MEGWYLLSCVPMDTTQHSTHTGAPSSQQKGFHSCHFGSDSGELRLEGPHMGPKHSWGDSTLKTASLQLFLALGYGLTSFFSCILYLLLQPIPGVCSNWAAGKVLK